MNAVAQAQTETMAADVVMMPVGSLVPNDYNPNHMTEEGFGELVEEVRHLGGLPKPVIVRADDDGFVIVDGEHGWRAAQEVGLAEVSCQVVDVDDFEARRQTYKRNQHGEHNPVLLGRMFRQMMEGRDLSQRGLAKKIEVSEGTIRNALLYAEAANLRNSYAREYEADVDADAQVSALAVRQLRYFMKLPPLFGHLWVEAGADMKALLGVKTVEAIDDVERAFLEQERDPIEALTENLAYLEQTGLVEFVTGSWRGEGFEKNLDQIVAWNKWECKWTWGMAGHCLTRKQLRPYTRHYFMGVFFVREESMMTSALDCLINTTTSPPSFYLTPEEFEGVLKDCDLVGRESHENFIDRLKLAILDKGGKTKPAGTAGVRWELMQRAIDAEAPDYIRESNLFFELKYLLWKLPGDEAAKRKLAKEHYISGSAKDGRENIAAAIAKVECEIEVEAEEKELQARLEKSTRQELATSLADRLFGETYKDKPDALRAVGARLAKLEKPELLAFDEFVKTEKEIRRWRETFEMIAKLGM